MNELIEQIKLKADSIPTNTEINRRVKGAYVDCLIMVKEATKNLVLADVSGQSEQLVCDMCGSFKLEHCGGGDYSCEECGHYPITN